MKYFGHTLINGFRSQTPRGFYDPAKGHTGIDLSTPIGSPISIPVETVVKTIRNQSQMGLTVYLKDPSANILVFSHLSSVSVKEGDQLAAGTVFAKSGNSGSATTGAHLHFEVIAQRPSPGLEFMTRTLGEYAGYNIDPTAYLESLTAVHWSDEAMEWAQDTGLITRKHDPNSNVNWGELMVVLHRHSMKHDN